MTASQHLKYLNYIYLASLLSRGFFKYFKTEQDQFLFRIHAELYSIKIMLCYESDGFSSDLKIDNNSEISYFDPYADLYKNPLWIFFWSTVFIMVQIFGKI